PFDRSRPGHAASRERTLRAGAPRATRVLSGRTGYARQGHEQTYPAAACGSRPPGPPSRRIELQLQRRPGRASADRPIHAPATKCAVRVRRGCDLRRKSLGKNSLLWLQGIEIKVVV